MLNRWVLGATRSMDRGMPTFHLLGPVGVVVDGRQIDFGSPKQRIVLAALLVEAGRPVGVDVLIDRVWDEAPGGAARRMVSTYVSRLRRALGQVHLDSGEPVELVRRSGGYELSVARELVDLHRFRRMVAAAEDRHRPDGERAGLLRDALGLWQGTALSDLPCGWAERMRQAWHQQRVDAAVAWARLELSLGHPKPVIGTVRELVAEHPLVEPLAEVLIQALDLDGRKAEALDCFAATRRRLIDELGVEPGAELRAVHDSVLRGQNRGREESPRISAGPPRESNRARGTGGAERQLPADVADFVGRTDEIARLREVLLAAAPGPRLAAVSGPPGVGKTALAVRTGHELASWFPDGQLYVALRGTSDEPADPAEVLAQLLRVLGVDGSALPAGADARGALFRSRLAGRRVLLILDDAGGHHQVEPLLPGDGAAVVVTSRAPLTGLPGVTTIDIHPLLESAAIELLSRVAGDERVRAEPAAAADLVVMCGGLPLAVRIAAARLAAHRHWSVETLAERLTDERRRLDELRHGDLAVRPGLQVAYRGLTPNAARAFALLGKLDVPSFADWPVAALLDTGPAVGAAALEELADARLVDELGPDVAGQMRYRFHEVTKAFARERQATDVGQADWAAALARVGASWLILARHAQDGLLCERHYLDDRSEHGSPAAVNEQAIGVAADRPLAWFEAERDALATLIPACAEAGQATLARSLAGCVADFYDLRGYYADWRRTTETALAACRRAGDSAGEAAMLRGLGSCLLEFDDVEVALTTLRAARALAEEIGEPAGAAMARKHIGLALSLTSRLDEAERELRAAAEESRRSGIRPTESRTLTHLGFVMRQRGDADGAVGTIGAALTIARACGDVFAQACADRGLAGALLDDGRTRDAERAARRAVALFERIGDPIGTAQSLRDLGEALARDPHRPDEAEYALASAATIFRDRGHAWGSALVELNLGEIEVRRGAAGAAERLRQTLRFWTDEKIPLLQARTLVALATAAEHRDDPSAGELFLTAYRIYEELKAPQAAELAERLGIRSDTTART